MASIQKLQGKNGTSWKVRIRRKGLPTLTETFKRKVDAEQWVREQEASLDKHGFHSLGEAKKTTLSEAIERYISEHHFERLSTNPTPAIVKRINEQKQNHTYKLKALREYFDDINRPMFEIRAKHLSAYRIKRQVSVANETIKREFSLISTTFNHAISEWGMEGLSNPVNIAKKPSAGKARNILATDEEINNITEALRVWRPHLEWFKPMVLFQMYVGLRAGEAAQIEPQDIDLEKRTIRLDTNKTDFPRDIPLSSKGVEILKSFEWGTDTVFKVAETTLSQRFTDFKKFLLDEGLIEQDIRLHDLRHYATTEYFKLKRPDGFPLLEIHHVRQITGHKSLDVMFNIYVNKLDANVVTSIPGF